MKVVSILALRELAWSSFLILLSSLVSIGLYVFIEHSVKNERRIHWFRLYAVSLLFGILAFLGLVIILIFVRFFILKF